jgi:acyl dehydratase
MRKFGALTELKAVVGQEIGISPWATVDQARIDLFAEATGDHQWIHTDPVRAATGPMGATIAHGYLTLSMIPMLMAQAMTVEGVRMGLNYGLDKVRFPSPLKSGSRIRAKVALASMKPIAAVGVLSGFELCFTVTIEAEGVDKPVCVAETMSRRYG